MSRVGGLGSLSTLVNGKKASSVLSPPKGRDCNLPSGLSKRVGNRKLDYIFIFSTLVDRDLPSENAGADGNERSLQSGKEKPIRQGRK